VTSPVAWTIRRKPPALPRPSTAGAPKTLMRASGISLWNRSRSWAAIASPLLGRIAALVKGSKVMNIEPRLEPIALKDERAAGIGERMRDAGVSARSCPFSARPLRCFERGGIGELDVGKRRPLSCWG